MTETISHSPRCRMLTTDLAVMALGALTGPEQVVVLDHVDTCPACRDELVALALVAEELGRFLAGDP